MFDVGRFLGQRTIEVLRRLSVPLFHQIGGVRLPVEEWLFSSAVTVAGQWVR